MTPCISILIPVYNRLENIERVLAGLEVQSFMDFEVVIGDDGSGQEVQQYFRSYSGPLNVTYIWQPDEGFRRSTVLNKAFAASSGSYCIFMDSDCIPHHHYVRDHWDSREKDIVLCGRRVELGPGVAMRLSVDDIRNGEHEKISAVLVRDILSSNTVNWEESIRFPHPALGRMIHWKKPALLGSNFSLDRLLFENVNGFNEEYVGYGLEDSDLAHRLQLAGAELKALRHAAIQYHLSHPKGEPSAKNFMIYERTLHSTNPVCENGLVRR